MTTQWWADNPPDIAAVFLQYSVLGAVALLGLWFFLVAYRREVKRADECEAALRELQSKLIDDYVPVLTKAAEVIADTAAELRRRDRR